MKKSAILLVGISAHTNNKNEVDANTAKIGLTIEKFFSEKLSEVIVSKKSEGIFYSVYTNYESDDTGNYTYFFGTEVTSFDNVNKNLETLIIPAQEYIKFTTDKGKLPEVVINKWQEIWHMREADFNGKRNYLADFEIYDERSHNPENAVVDIFIGINKDLNL